MDVRFVAPDLRKLDLLDSEALALPVHLDERPLRGTTGLVDWRMAGRLSRLAIRGRLTGEQGEHLLVPSSGRFPFDKIVLVGAGPSASLDLSRARSVMAGMLLVLDALRIRRAAVVLPGRSWELLDAALVMEALAPMIVEPHEVDALTVIDTVDEHRALARAHETAKRRARADAG